MTTLTNPFNISHVLLPKEDTSLKQEVKTHIFHQQTALSIETKEKKKKEKTPIKKGFCNNRECNNASGYTNKPNSIYCSARCQSRGMIFSFHFPLF